METQYSVSVLWLASSTERCVRGLIDKTDLAYLCQPWAKWQTVVPSKTPYLSASCRDLTDHGRNQRDDYQCNHDVRARVAVGDVVEKLDEGVVCWTAEKRLRVRDGEAERKDRDVAEDGVKDDTPEDRSWKGLGRIFDLFCYCSPSHMRSFFLPGGTSRGRDRWLTHMHCAIESKHTPQRRQKSYHECNTHRRPIAPIGQFQKCDLGRVSRRKHPERYYRCEQADDMYKQDEPLNKRKLLREASIENDGKCNDGNNEQGSMPSLGVITWIVERDEALDDGSGKE